MAENLPETQWIEVKIRCNGEIAEALADVLGRFVSNGVVVESVTKLNPHNQEYESTGEVDVFGYLTFDEHIETQRQKLAEALWHLEQITPIPQPTYTPIKDQNWMEAWKKNYHPLAIGKRFLILPAWVDPPKNEQRLLIRINPAMAFGTGTHPSTKLCLHLMEAHLSPGHPVIDVGCGSGILSIAALKMGASQALAIDISAKAIASTQENVALNDIDPAHLEIEQGSVDAVRNGSFSLKQAPFVLVNILAPIIIRLFGQGLADLVTPGGLIFLSGILDHQGKMIRQAAKAVGLQMVDQLTIEDWVGLAFRK